MTKDDNRLVYAVLFFIAFAFVVSSTYNPFNFRRMHNDSAVYTSVAQGIIRGELPYRDFADNKGPVLYFISAAGLKLAGFTGIWLAELLLALFGVFFAYKSALLWTNKKYLALYVTAGVYIAALEFFVCPGGTEEYALPFLMASFYIFARYFFLPQNSVRFREIVVLGFCFACSVMIRLNMFPLWAGFCALIFIDCALKRRFLVLLKYVAAFCAGALIVCVPIYLYLSLNGIFDDFVTYVIKAGAQRGFDGGGLKNTAKTFFNTAWRGYSYIPLPFGIFMIITNAKKRFFYAAYSVSHFLTLLFFSFNGGGEHYNLMLMPYYVPVLIVFFNAIENAFAAFRAKYVLMFCFFCLVFSWPVAKYADDFLEIFSNDSGRQLKLAGKMIDDNTGPDDEIISLDKPYIYPFTRRKAVSRYIYQLSGMGYIPSAFDDFLNDVYQKRPKIIAIFTAEDGNADYLPGKFKPVLELISRDYRLLSDENGYILYIRN